MRKYLTLAESMELEERRRIEQSPNCLRCRLCSPLPATNMSNAHPIIFCGELNQPREMKLEGCLAAPEGAQTHYASEVEIAYLREHYPEGERDAVAASVKRSARATQLVAAKRGIFRGGNWKQRRAQVANAAACEAHQRSGAHFSPAQSAYIARASETDAWPAAGGAYWSAGFRSEQEQKREAIVARVAQLGPPRSWEQIKYHRHRSQPSYLKSTEARRAAQSARQRARRARARQVLEAP